jgi:hypothetical protein
LAGRIKIACFEAIMKKRITFFSIMLLAAAPFCHAQTDKTQPKLTKATSAEAALIDLEKSEWEAYKNKQPDAFKKSLATDYYAVYADGIKNLTKEVADMATTDLRDYAFAEMKVVFSGSDVAIMTYKVTVQASSGGKDVSGTYNAESVWAKQGGRWLGVSHTEVKAE